VYPPQRLKCSFAPRASGDLRLYTAVDYERDRKLPDKVVLVVDEDGARARYETDSSKCYTAVALGTFLRLHATPALLVQIMDVKRVVAGLTEVMLAVPFSSEVAEAQRALAREAEATLNTPLHFRDSILLRTLACSARLAQIQSVITRQDYASLQAGVLICECTHRLDYARGLTHQAPQPAPQS
jgi:hypothetical protein